MTFLQIVVFTLLLVAAGWPLCKTQEEDTYTLNEPRIHKSHKKNKIHDVELDSEFLNLKIKHGNELNARPTTYINNHIYDKEHNLSNNYSTGLDLKRSGKSPISSRIKKNNYLKNDHNIADIGINDALLNSNEPTSNRVSENHRKRKKIKNTKHENNNFINKDLSISSINKFATSHKNKQSQLAHTHEFKINDDGRYSIDSQPLTRNKSISIPNKSFNADARGETLIISNVRRKVHRNSNSGYEVTNYENRDTNLQSLGDKNFKGKGKSKLKSKHIDKKVQINRHGREIRRLQNNENLYNTNINTNTNDGFETISKVEPNLHTHNDVKHVSEHGAEVNEIDKKPYGFNDRKPANMFENEQQYNTNKMFATRNHLSQMNGVKIQANCDKEDKLKSSTHDMATTEHSTTVGNKDQNNTSNETVKYQQNTDKACNTNTSSDEKRQYEAFLSGQLAEELVRLVMKKVVRARKIMLELGFGNHTDEECERCTELTPSNITELEDLKQSIIIVSHQDRLKCHRLPDTMEKYLNELLSYKKENEYVARTFQDESFIFMVDYNDRILQNNRIGKNYSFEIKRLGGQNMELKNNNRNRNSTLKSSGERDKTVQKETIREEKFNQTKPESKSSLQSNIGSSEKQFEFNNNDFIQETENGPIQNSVRTDSKIFNKRMNAKTKESGDLTDVDDVGERKVRKPNYEKDTIDSLNYQKINHQQPYPQNRETDGSAYPSNLNTEDINDKNKENRFKSLTNNLFHPYFTPGNTYDQQNKDVFGHKPVEYAKSNEAYRNIPEVPIKNWQNVEYQLYPNQQNFDFEDSKTPIRKNEYNVETRVVKRDTQPSSDLDNEDKLNLYDAPEEEYDLY